MSRLSTIDGVFQPVYGYFRMKAVILLSGGIDSTTTMAIAKSEGCELYALTIDYGQRHVHEIEKARLVSKFLMQKQIVVSVNLRDRRVCTYIVN